MSQKLQLSPPFHRFQHGDLIGIFDVAADGDTHRDARDFHSGALELLREIGGGGFAFDRRIGCDDDLVHVAGVDTSDQIGDAQLLRANAVEWGDGPVQNVEGAVEVLGLFDGGDVRGLFDYADQALVTGGASAIDAGVDVGDVVADGAQAQVGFDVAHGGREGFGVFVAGTQDVEGESLRAL